MPLDWEEGVVSTLKRSREVSRDQEPLACDFSRLTRAVGSRDRRRSRQTVSVMYQSLSVIDDQFRTCIHR